MYSRFTFELGFLVTIRKWQMIYNLVLETFVFFIYMSTGPPLARSKFVVAVNWKGIFFMDERDKRLVELSYLEVKDVNTMKYG